RTLGRFDRLPWLFVESVQIARRRSLAGGHGPCSNAALARRGRWHEIIFIAEKRQIVRVTCHVVPHLFFGRNGATFSFCTGLRHRGQGFTLESPRSFPDKCGKMGLSLALR